jgi:glycosyltransferase involved in cell wall biosynthesis
MQSAIYTIAKNEAHNVKGFMAAAEGADVYVLDTGSEDDTVALFKEHGANVKQKIITPWRFDAARNEALAMVPKSVDVCVSLDLDERIESGWAKKLENEWSGNVGNYMYIADWQDQACTIPCVQSPRTRLHNRNDYEWHRQIHEVIRPLEGVEMDSCNTSILVKHYQSGGQRNYAPILKELLKKNPGDADAWLQLAGELHQKKEYSGAIDAYKSYVKVTQEDDHPSIRYRKAHAWLGIAQCLVCLGETAESIRAFLSAVAAEPGCREAWTHFAHVVSQLNNAPLAYGAAMTAYNIQRKPEHAAIETACWGELPKEIADKELKKIYKDN